MSHAALLLLPLAVLALTAATSYLQHRYYSGTVRTLATRFDRPDLYLVSGRGKGRLRGALVILVLRRSDRVIEHASVMEGATILARFKERRDWVGLPAGGPLPRCSKQAARGVMQALEQLRPSGATGPVLRGATTVGIPSQGATTAGGVNL